VPALPLATDADFARAPDWAAIERELDAFGHARIPGLLDEATCRALSACYDDDALFRSRVVMARHGFGRGEYKYFAHPLPPAIDRWRAVLYAKLAPVSNRWNERMGIDARFPPGHADFIARCHAAGQTRPTPLLLRYGVDDYNCLHQDLYGEHVFPLQVAVLLAQPARDFEGGEFVLTEQRPRMQSRVHVVPLRQGDALVFAVNQRPVRGARGDYRVAMRHGVSRVLGGRRHALGLILHDAT
jgi:hypothetical protein